MRRFFKILAWVVGIVAAVLIAAVLYILLIFDPNKYKADIVAAVHDATGRELTIQGELKLSVFPWLGVETGAMTLSNLPKFGHQPMAKIEDASIKIQLLPLLRKDVKVDTVTLNGLYLNLTRNANGEGNWEDLTAKNVKEPAPSASSNSIAAPTLATFAIGGIRIENATVIWDDRHDKARYELSSLSLHTGPIAPGAPVKVTMATDIKSTAPAIIAHLNLSTQALYQLDTQHLQLTGLNLTTDARGEALPADEAKITLTTDALLEIPESRYRLSKLQLLTSLRGDKLPGKQVTTTLGGNVMLDLDKGTVTVTPLSLETWNVKANGSIHGHGLLSTPSFTGSLTIADFNGRELLGHFSSEPLRTADKQALGTIGVHLEFDASSTYAEITKLEAKLDQTRITGKAAIKDFSHPTYRFQLAADDIDADRYLPPADVKKTKPATPATAAGASAAELPLTTLRALNINGDMTIGKFKIAGLKLNDLKLGINAAGGLIRANPLAAQLYGGSYRGDLRLDARGKAVQLGMNETLSNIEIGPLTQDLLRKDLVAGTGNVRLQLHGTGITPDELKRTVTGEADFSLRNGRVNGVNLLEMIQKDYLKYVQALAIDAGKLNQTVFSKFAATATIDKGLITTKNLVLNSAQLDVKGHGNVNLVNERVAMHLDATPIGQLAKQLGQFKNTVIPIRVEGTLSAPKFATDLDEVLKQQVKARLEKEKQKAKEKLQQKLKQQQEQAEKKLQKQLQNKLNDLFK